MAEIELFHFPGSHFNEKARWGLDLKRIEHERISLLPGPHMRTVKKLTGMTQTPVLRVRGEVIAGSTPILEFLERTRPEPALFPKAETDAARARSLLREWDDEIGPAVRLVKFFEVMDARYASGTFCQGRNAVVRGLYRSTFPLVGALMKNKMGIDAKSAAAARNKTRRAFDFVAKASTRTGYLMGDRFSVADLACAALLMPCVEVGDWGGPAEASTEKSRRWHEKWADHPGAEWVREIYRRHRSPES
ncbi:MAG TPA: glutathione S-transferase family protein [Deltaproteobacteria bacterium]|nr:glutathione S-transferase family protein [Deltaproteobacteria bacterium]